MDTFGFLLMLLGAIIIAIVVICVAFTVHIVFGFIVTGILLIVTGYTIIT